MRLVLALKREKQGVLLSCNLEGPKNFSASFLVGRVILKNCALTNARFPTLKSGAGSRLVSDEVWYACRALRIAQ